MTADADRAATAQTNGRIGRLTGWFDRLLPFRGLRPLRRIPSLKAKLSIVVVAAIGVAVATNIVGFWLNLRPRVSLAIAVLFALAMVQILARGITRPVRAMADAADRMAGGDYHQAVTAEGAHEIGQLARSFNLMASHIAELEQQHKDLIANVSHDSVVVAVADSGPGIAADRVDGVFDRFERCTHPTIASGGAGLGLAIGRWVAELHGGSLGVFNTHPGCRFELALPLTPDHAAAVPERSP